MGNAPSVSFMFWQRDGSAQPQRGLGATPPPDARPWRGSFDFFTKAPGPPPRASPAGSRRRHHRQHVNDPEAPSLSPGSSFNSALSDNTEEGGGSTDVDDDSLVSARGGSSPRDGRGLRTSAAVPLPRPARVLDIRGDTLARVSIDVRSP